MKLTSKLLKVRLSETTVGGFVESGKPNILQFYFVDDGKFIDSITYG